MSESRYTLFDDLGRLTQSQQITDGQTYTSGYQYNLSGALVQQTYPSGRTVSNQFEADGDLSRIYGKANPNAVERTYANSFSYTPDGRIEKLRLGNGRWEWAKFNERLQVTELNLGSGVQDASLWKLKYEYGEINSNGDVDPTKNTGNIARLTTSFSGLANPFVQTFKYDSLYRLVEAKEKSGANENWKELFSYDRYGNRIGYEKYLNTVQQTLDNKTHPTINPATNRFNTNQGYTYDFNGNLVIDAEGRNFTFNGDNKQSVIKNGNDLLAEYFYDGEGKRVKKKVYNPTETVKEETVFVYDGLGKLIAEYSTAAPPPNPTTSYTATDQLGSPRVITNSQGEIVSRRDFMPFGEELANDPNYRTTALKYNTGDGIRQKFTGYQKDEETNLDFAEARMYENRHARFTAVDPLLASGKSANPQTFNRYVYVMNNPLVYTDPDGLQAGNHRGTVYYRDLGNGNIALANYKKDGYEKYMGRRRTMTGTDGYKYTLFRGGWTQGRKVAPSQVYFGNSEGAVKAKTTGYVNKELVNSLAENGQRKFNTAALVVGGGGLVGGIAGAGCIMLCGPAIAVGGPAAANAIGSPVTQGIIAGLAGGGIGMVVTPSGGSGGGLPPELSGRLSNIYSQYPKDSFQCDCAANETLDAFKQVGIDGKIVQLETGLDTMMSSDGTVISRNGFHQAVQVGDKFYDALTGSEGATWDVYQTLIQQDQFYPLTITEPRPYIPPQQ